MEFLRQGIAYILLFWIFILTVGNIASCVTPPVEQTQKITEIHVTKPVNEVSITEGMPFSAFMSLISTIYVEEKIQNKTKIKTERATASGSIVMRSKIDDRFGYVLTAKHFCDHSLKETKFPRISHEFKAYDFNGRAHRALLYYAAQEPWVDACVLLIKTMDQHIEIAAPSLEGILLGERVFNMAAPGGYHTAGTVLLFEGFYSGGLKQAAWFTIPIAMGSSGSPILNKKGELVGMIWGYPLLNGGRVMENMAYSLHLDDIRKIIVHLQILDKNIKKISDTLEAQSDIVPIVITSSKTWSPMNLDDHFPSSTKFLELPDNNITFEPGNLINDELPVEVVDFVLNGGSK